MGGWYYSELAAQLRLVKAQKAPAPQWKTIIQGLKQRGVKQEEIDWSGIDDFLDLQKGSVNKHVLMAFLDGRGVEIRETVAPDTYEGAMWSPDGTVYMGDDLRLTVTKHMDSLWYLWDGQKKQKHGPFESSADARAYAERTFLLKRPVYGLRTRFHYYQLPGGANYREMVLTLPGEELYPAPEAHRLGRKEADTNRLLHLRFNERRDDDGKRVLFLEEIQSDWAQEGREKGFGPVNVPPGPFVGETQSWVALALKRAVRYAAEQGFDRVAWTTGAQQADRYDLSKQVSRIRASEVGGDRILLEAFRSRRGIGDQRIETSVMAEEVPRGKLADYVGKELADRINQDHAKGRKVVDYRGHDLRIGGHGMLVFYDRIVPLVANKLIKRFGGVPVGASVLPEIGAQPGFDLTPTLRENALTGLPLFSQAEDQRLRDLLKTYAGEKGAPSEAEIAEAVRQYREVERRYAEALRAHDEDGKPLPAPNGEPSKLNREQWILVRTPNFKRWFGDWDAAAETLRGLDALRTVVDRHEDVLAAMRHPDLGEVSLYWGKKGDPAKAYKNGAGISHIIARRLLEDGNPGATAEVLVRVIRTIANGKIARQYGGELGRVDLSFEGHTAVLSKQRYGNRETWLLTGFEDKPDAGGESYNPASYAPIDSVSRQRVGAELDDTLDQWRGKINKEVSGPP